MNESDITRVINVMHKLWPRSEWSVAEWQLAAAGFTKFKIRLDKAVSIVEEVKRNSNFKSPPFSDLTKALQTEHNARMRDEEMQVWANSKYNDKTPDYYPGGLTMSQARKMWSSGRKEAVHPDWWPVLEELDRYPGILAKYADQKGTHASQSQAERPRHDPPDHPRGGDLQNQQPQQVA